MWDNLVWLILSFQGFYINFHRSWCSNVYLKAASGALRFDPYCPSIDLIVIQISTKSFGFFLFCFFWYSKTYSKNCIRDNMVWPILFFQGSYINVHLTLVNFLVLKIYWKLVSGAAWFNRYFSFQGFYQVFIKDSCFFSVSKVLKKFESPTIWFDLYRPFRKHWSIFIKST